MSKEKRIPKEYAIVISLMIFFTIVIITGATRVYLITKDRINTVDLTNIDILEQNTNVDLASYNSRIANSIRQKYNVDIYYGISANAESVEAIPVMENETIFNMLKIINNVLEEYPQELISEIESRGYELSIHLVDHFKVNVEALANRNSIGQMKIYMSNTEDIKRAMHHEFFHVLDYYIRLETDENIAYLNWSSYNPRGFEYIENINNITSKYVYDGNKGAFFVTPYAKCSEKEDRAETFAEMLTADKEEVFFNEDEPIRGKMDILGRVLENTFETIRRADNLSW